MSQNPALDQFAAKVIRHNNLVPEEKLNKAIALQKTKPQFSLLEVLLKTRLIQPAHYKQITTLYKSQPKKPAAPAGTQTRTPSQSPPEANPLVPGGDSELIGSGGFETMDMSEAQPSSPPPPPPSSDPVSTPEEIVFQDTDKTPESKRPGAKLRDRKKAEELRKKEARSKTSKPKEEAPIEILPSSEDLFPFLNQARESGASDLHIIPNSPPIARINGQIKRFEEDTQTSDQTEKLLFGILPEEDQIKLRKELSLDTCLDLENGGRVRVCIVKQDVGWDGSFRLIQEQVPSMEDLGLPDEIKRMTEFQQGLVLITGASGMGKTTTMASMIHFINQHRNEHIITLEDPIEYVIPPVKSHISQRELHSHTQSFSAALRAALREDPDVIMIGELRDEETASLAITAAETGHLVFASLPTNSATQTITRLLDFFSPEQQHQIRVMISESIRGIVCQKLIPNTDKTGRVLALEILFNIPAIGNLVREDRMHQLANMMRINHNLGMMMMDDSIKALLQNKMIDPEEAHFAVVDQMIFQGEGNN